MQDIGSQQIITDDAELRTVPGILRYEAKSYYLCLILAKIWTSPSVLIFCAEQSICNVLTERRGEDFLNW